MARSFVYTNYRHSTYAIMSAVFGMLSLMTFVICILKSFESAGVGVERFGASATLASFFMLVGFGLCIYSFFEVYRFKLFKIIGLVLNSLAFIMLSIILYAGAVL